MIVSKRNSIFSKIIVNTVFVLVCLTCIIPLLTVITISISKDSAIMNYGYSIIPHKIDFTAYKYILMYPQGIIRAYGISILVTTVGCTFSLLVSSMFAYSISRKDFRFRSLFTLIVLFTMLFNGGIVSNYIVVTNYYKLQDNILALILPYAVVPMYVLILRTFFNSIPLAIIESAKIDGANEFYTFFRIVIPLSKPAIASVGLLILLLYWNDWWLGLLYINSDTLVPIQLLLNRMMQNVEFLRSTAMGAAGSNIKASDFPSESARMAMCVLAAGPMLFVFPFFQKYFVKGLTVGSVKG